MKKNHEIHFLLVGDGKERAYLEARTRELGLTNVTFTGSQPKTRMPEVLAASDACVATLQPIPMFQTTYANKVFDYMAAGRPTILANDGVIRQVVEAASGGIFVPPGNSGALAAAVLELADDPSAASQMGASARDFVVRHFNREGQAHAFLELTTHLIGEGGKGILYRRLGKRVLDLVLALEDGGKPLAFAPSAGSATLLRFSRSSLPRNRTRPPCARSMKVMAAEARGFIAVPTVALKDAVGHYAFEKIGDAAKCRLQFHAITAERRIAHPAAALITRHTLS